MKAEELKNLLKLSKIIQDEIEDRTDSKAIIGNTRYSDVFDYRLTENTRGYIQKVAAQINGSYKAGYYDACAVMIRRLLETLIIEVYEHFKVDSEIKNPSGEYMYLKDLISNIKSSKHWNLGRNIHRSLTKLKDIGDKSAHSRRFNAQKKDIDDMKSELRDVIQELLYLAKLK